MNQELLAGMSSEEQALLLEDAYVTTCSHIHNVHDVHNIDSEQFIFADFDQLDGGNMDDLPVFPVDSLPLDLREYVEAVANNIQVPVDMAASFALAVCALCVQGKYTIQPKAGWVEPLNLYIAVVAPPSERKSPTINAVTRAVYDFEREENERLTPLVEAYKTQHNILSRRLNNLIEAASKPKATEDIALDVRAAQDELSRCDQNAVTLLRLIADDTTPEALASLMAANNGRMAVISSEGGIFDTVAGRYSNTPNLDLFLKAYSGDNYRVDRKGRAPEYIDNPCLTMCLTFQPSVMSEIAGNGTFTGRGFLQRFLYCMPKTTIGKRTYDTPAIPPEVEERYKNMIGTQLSDATEEPHNLQLDGEAFRESEKFFYELEDILRVQLKEDAGGFENGWTGKIHGTTMRIAGILHVVSYGIGARHAKVNKNTMRAAIQIGRYYMQHSLRVFRSLGLVEDQCIKEARYLWDRIQEFDTLHVKKRDLWLKCRNKKSMFSKVADMKPALDELTERGYICVEVDRSNRKPSEIIHVNPSISRAS